MGNKNLNTPNLSESTEEREGNLSDKTKDVFLDMLEKGFNIKNESGYNAIKNILFNITGIELCAYNDINSRGIHKGMDSYEFSLTLEKGSKKVYLYPPMEGYGASSYGYIKNGNFIEDFSGVLDLGQNNSEFSMIDKKLLEYGNKGEPKPDITYIIEKGDNLWNIIKKNYNMESNTDIANVINEIVHYNTLHGGKGLLNIDKTGDKILGDNIYVGDKLLLPTEVQFGSQIFNRVIK